MAVHAHRERMFQTKEDCFLIEDVVDVLQLDDTGLLQDFDGYTRRHLRRILQSSSSRLEILRALHSPE